MCHGSASDLGALWGEDEKGAVDSQLADCNKTRAYTRISFSSEFLKYRDIWLPETQQQIGQLRLQRHASHHRAFMRARVLPREVFFLATATIFFSSKSSAGFLTGIAGKC